MTPAVPTLFNGGLTRTARLRHQPQVRVMDQRCGLQSLAGLLLCQLLRRQLAQLIVDERQELLGGVRVTLLDGGQDAGDVAHDSDNKPEMTGKQALRPSGPQKTRLPETRLRVSTDALPG